MSFVMRGKQRPSHILQKKGGVYADMLNYIKYLDIPTKVAFVIVGVFFISQIIGEILELKGNVVPEIMKIRKYFSRKKMEKDLIKNVPKMFLELKSSIDEFQKYYSPEAIKKRDEWIDSVNARLDNNDRYMQEIDKKMDKHNSDILTLLIDSKRSAIIGFASRVVDEKSHVTREEFNRAIKLYNEYENIIKENNLTNGEVNIAYRIIKESYESHMKNHTFIEDILGYDIK